MPADVGFVQGLSGNLVLAGYFNWGFMGILCIQVYAYYIAFPKDRLVTKILVYSVFILEILQTVLTSIDIFVALGTSIGASDPLNVVDEIYHHWFSIPVSGGITGGIGQLFFAYRIWIMSQSGSTSGQITSMTKTRFAPFIVGTLAVGSLVSALVCASTFFHADTFSILLGNNSESNGSESMASIGVWNGIGAICDIVIALSMPYYLMRHGTGLPSTHVMVVKLVRLIFETGIFTAVIAITHLCLYFGGTSTFIIPGLSLSKVYANTMLVILNNRMEIVSGRSGREESQISSDIDRSPVPAFRSVPARNRQRSTIIVSNDRLTFRMDDIPPPMPMPKAEFAKRSMEGEVESLSDQNKTHIGKVHHIPQFMASEADVRYAV